MKFGRCLLIASQALLFIACAKSEHLPTRKDGFICNVTFEKDNHIQILNSKPIAPIDEEYRFSINIPYVSDQNADWMIPPTKASNGQLGLNGKEYNNEEYVLLPDNIHVFIGGEEFKDSYNFYYASNVINEFVIKKEYMVNDVRIVLNSTERDTELSLFGLEFSPTLQKHLKDYGGEEFEEKPYVVSFKSKYQNTFSPIKIYGGRECYPIFEHDYIDLTIKVDEDKFKSKKYYLPDDIMYRTNARYAKEGTDYTIEYVKEEDAAEEEKKYIACHIIIYNYVVCDHGTITANGER